MGEVLAARILREWPKHDIDVVIPIPDTSRTAALPLAYHLGVKYREGFIKNRYIGRTFIMSGQSERKKSVRQKLNPIPLEFEGKNVLLVDDSIVRGTTSREIIEMARGAGAKKVYFASASPPVRYPNVYGIDMPTPDEFIAYDRSIHEVCTAIGADRLFYQELNDLISAVTRGSTRVQCFDTSCFDGRYITGGVTQDFLARNPGNSAQRYSQRTPTSPCTSTQCGAYLKSPLSMVNLSDPPRARWYSAIALAKITQRNYLLRDNLWLLFKKKTSLPVLLILCNTSPITIR